DYYCSAWDNSLSSPIF
nr:immunoglobulin light chain junction region [Macaca mulatta]MOV99247.1 immunoglobulin light chain junction region [Macaca mulatta]MOW00241.1 immunoglobulin light chain junction region [Macaca mulatta]